MSKRYYESALLYEFKQWFSTIHDSCDLKNWNALLIVSEIRKKSLNIEDFAKILPTHKGYLDQVDLYNGLGKIGFQVNFETFSLSQLDERIFPSLYKNDESTFVITSIIKNDHGAVLEAIDTNTREYKEISFSENTPVGLIIIKDEKTSQPVTFLDEHTHSGTSWFKPIIERFDPLFYQIFFSTIILGVFSVFSPLFIMYSFVQISDGSHSNLGLMSVGALAIVFAEFAIRNIRSKSINWISSRIGHIIGLKVFEKLLWLPSLYVEIGSTSAQISKLKTFDTIRDFLQSPIFKAILDVPMAITSIILLAFIGHTLVFIPLATIAIYFIITLFINYKIWNLTQSNLKFHSAKQNLALETFEKRFSLRNSGVSEIFMERNRDASGSHSYSRFKLNFFNSLIENSISSLTTISAAATIFLGIHLVWDGTLSPATIIISTILLGKILQPFQIAATSLPKIQQFYSVVQQLNKLMDIKTEYNEETIKKKRIEKINGSLIFNRVGVKFTKESDPIFTSLNLRVEAGETVALTGLNGSGKSTLLKLVNGMYRPQIGSIAIDGYDIRQVSATNLRRSIAYAPQTPQFFQGSIIENIRMGNPLATASQVSYIIEELQLMDELKHIKEGLQAQINSELLSRTQSTLLYKLALARTMISNSNIILIDELPFSILSGPIGASLYQFIENWKGHRTTLFVSNSENFIKLSDKSVFLQRNQSPLIADPDVILQEVNREKIAA